MASLTVPQKSMLVFCMVWVQIAPTLEFTVPALLLPFVALVFTLYGQSPSFKLCSFFCYFYTWLLPWSVYATLY
jgi:hypothetical protein